MDHSDKQPQFNDPFHKIENSYNNSIQLQNFGVSIKFIGENLLTVKVSQVNELHLGLKGINWINGAIISYLFDLALGLTAYMVRDILIQSSVTSRIEVQFKRPLVTKEIVVYAKVKQSRKNLIDSEAWILDDSGQISAKADGILFTKQTIL